MSVLCRTKSCLSMLHETCCLEHGNARYNQPANSKHAAKHSNTGVRIKGTRLARMQDGIFTTEVPDMYR